jgi:hypothetical protein
MERLVARTGLVTAGFVLSAVLMLAASCEAAPDCRTSPGSPGCPSPRAVKTIAPLKPGTPPKSAAAPKPKPEPRAVPTEARPQPAANKPPQGKIHPARTARNTRRGGGMAQNSRSYRYGGQPALWSRWPYDHNDRPASGPVYEAERGPSPSTNCDEACRYRAWFQDYDAWYQRYGRAYAEYPPAPGALDVPAPSAGDRNGPLTRPAEAYIRSERDRLDPWHGYDGHDGPQNGY